MAPEIIKGIEADFRADLYSFGVVLYETVSGKNPFYADDNISIMKNQLYKLPSLSTEPGIAVSAGLCMVIMKLISKNPGDRYGNANEVIEDLTRIMNAGFGSVIGRKRTFQREDAEKKYFLSGRFVGRDGELRILKEKYESCKAHKKAESLSFAARRVWGKRDFCRNSRFTSSLTEHCFSTAIALNREGNRTIPSS